MDFEFLKEVRMVQFTNLITLQLTKDAKDADKIQALEDYVEKLDTEIKRRNGEVEKAKRQILKPRVPRKISRPTK